MAVNNKKTQTKENKLSVMWKNLKDKSRFYRLQFNLKPRKILWMVLVIFAILALLSQIILFLALGLIDQFN